MISRDKVLNFTIFVVVGSFAASIAIMTRILFYVFVNYELSVALGHLCGMVVAFYLNLQFVFRRSVGSIPLAFVRFSIANALSLTIAVVISSFAYRLLLPGFGNMRHSDIIAHVFGAACAVPSSYMLHSIFSFRAVVDRKW